ncbi:hypothetical protein KC952_02800 [Candidatus Saccharibacteria bacterium]|jgi:hypothetical protein|nr:hypothetical protein [Candidatus Saccharibacteria bacterium]
MDEYTTLAIIAVAALAHASFQLSISMLTLLSSHTIGKKNTHNNLLLRTHAFVIGAGVMTLLLISSLALVLSYIYSATATPLFIWIIGCGLLTGVGISVAIFYYRKEAGTSLWIPRPMARYLSSRTKSTSSSAESFSLGMVSAISEILFTLAPIFIAAFSLVQLHPIWQLVGIAVYTIISLSSLIVVNCLISSGHSISKVQKWREANKRFLQLASGALLIILAVYIYVEHVMLAVALTAAGEI